MSSPLRVLFLSSEADPFVKVGGLGDVAGSLPPALLSLPYPIDVRLVLPYFDLLDLDDADPELVSSFTIKENDRVLPAKVFSIVDDNLQVYLVSGNPIQTSQGVYSDDGAEDARKFSFFSKAAMKLARSLGWQPDIIHAHDWHTSPAVYYLHLIRNSDSFYYKTRSLLTVHNLPYLGHGAENALNDFGLPAAAGSSLPGWAQHLPLPLGLLTADKINTVSKGYAREILAPEYSAGLEDFLKTRENDIHGILNGLDMDKWNPETDEQIVKNYGNNELGLRKDNKLALLEEVELELDPDRPLLAMINRMDYQKGVDLVPQALEIIAEKSWQTVILGTGNPDLEEQIQRLDTRFRQVRTIIRYDAGLARRIYAGADMIIIPSRYEPCGLTQMIAMRYGCVPVARATGGLQDTIGDYHAGPAAESTGFLFPEATPASLAHALRRALQVYDDNRRWRGLQRRGMKKDFSWENSAREYLELYKKLVEN